MIVKVCYIQGRLVTYVNVESTTGARRKTKMTSVSLDSSFKC